MYRKYFKRLLDLFVSAIALVLALPILLITYLILIRQNRGNAFFLQERPGQLQKPFKIIKFKTVSDAKDSAGNLLPDNQRITRAGAVIRKLSIDELPQLVNVLKGEMSLVGPRPLLYKYIPLYSKEQLRRHEVRPGITGWAQVNGRNTISWTRKFELDVEYIDKLSFALDMKVIWFTVIKVLKRDGINQSTERPMQPFNGFN